MSLTSRYPSLASVLFLTVLASFPSTAARAQDAVERRAVITTPGLESAPTPQALLEELADKWSSFVAGTYRLDAGMWRQRLHSFYDRADIANLQAAVRQDSYDGAMAALVGRDIIGSRLGDLNGDLTYTPVIPCRIVDTRNTNTIIPANGSANFVGVGAASYTGQGGSATNCGVNGVAATALAINVTAIAPAAGGFTTVFPFNTTQPLAASLLYTPGSFVTNTVIAQIPNPVGTFDFTIYSLAESHYAVDLVGYFAPAQATPLDCIDGTTASFTSSSQGAIITVVPPACSAGYTSVSFSCDSDNSFITSVGRVNTNNCQQRIDGVGTVTISTRRRCCRVPGR